MNDTGSRPSVGDEWYRFPTHNQLFRVALSKTFKDLCYNSVSQCSLETLINLMDNNRWVAFVIGSNEGYGMLIFISIPSQSQCVLVLYKCVDRDDHWDNWCLTESSHHILYFSGILIFPIRTIWNMREIPIHEYHNFYNSYLQ